MVKLCAAKEKTGFTLVELATVVAIIALLIGGVMGGRMMMKHQEMRQITTDANGYIIAFLQFKRKYGEIPGDFANATNVWGTVGGGTAQCASPNDTPSVGTTTCNGNGNGYLDYPHMTTLHHEPYRAWQHMAAAGLITGDYLGVASSPFVASFINFPNASIPGILYGYRTTYPMASAVPPGSKVKTAFTWMSGSDAVVNNAGVADDFLSDGDYSNALVLDGLNASNRLGRAIFQVQSLTPTETQLLDLKSDDGFPLTGFIRTVKNYSAWACSTVSGTYDLTNSAVICSPIFMTSLREADQR